MSVMDFKHPPGLTLAVTTSVLFDMSEADAVFREKGTEAFSKYMRERKDVPLKKGEGYEYVEAFASIPGNKVLLASRNSGFTAIRALRALFEDDIIPQQFMFTNGHSPVPYLDIYGVNQFLSVNEDDVRYALARGIPSNLFSHSSQQSPPSIDIPDNVLRMKPSEGQGRVIPLRAFRQAVTPVLHHVFDFDGVLADASSERVYQELKKLEIDKEVLYRKYAEHEGNLMNRPLNQGPKFPFFKAVSEQNQGDFTPNLISIATARSVQAAFRCIYTLANWGIEPNGEIHCLNGAEKGPFLKVMHETTPGKMIFYDDGLGNVESAKRHGITAALIPDEGVPPEPVA